MPITIGSNIASLTAQRRLASSASDLSATFQRLSSGQRINRASDDAAGLAISQDLNARSRVYGQAVRNINDGVSVLAIADAAVSSLVDINTRLQELAEQAANGVYSSRQRESIDAEAQALAKEYFRISRSAQFNGTRLFDGSMSDGLRLQLGYGLDGSIHSNIAGKLGTGSASVSLTFNTESASSAATALGDINGDGILDLVTAGTGSTDGYATVRLGLGDGTFGAATSYLTENNGSNAVALNDLNGDGVLDLITAGLRDGGGGSVTIRLGTGNGSFGAATSYQMESSVTTSLAVGDLNGDGILDLVTAGTGAGSGRATIRLGNGNGSFGAATSISTNSVSTVGVTLGDVNGDGILDLLAVGTSGGTPTASIRLGVGNGSFGAASNFATGETGASSITVGDINGDGKLDLITSGRVEFEVTPGEIFIGGGTNVRLGNGDGTFSAATSFLSGMTGQVRLADLNGDGHLDIVSTHHQNEIGIRLGNGQGNFSETSYISSGIFAGDDFFGAVNGGIAIGDLNGDGVLDVAMATTEYYGGGKGAVFLGKTRDGISPLAPFSLKSRADALQALGLFNRGSLNLSQIRGTIGATQSRLNAALGVVVNSKDNIIAANSRIIDADIAAESANLTRTQILQQAAVSVLASANLQPELALRLLR